MNCKPGDLAVVVKTHCEAMDLLGKVILVGAAEPAMALPHWRAVPPVIDPKDGKEWVFADMQLRPIRDQDGEDETLQWAGLPHKQGVSA